MTAATPALRTFDVPTGKRDGFYTVTLQADGTLTCTCPDFVYRRSRTYGAICKHGAPIQQALRAERLKRAVAAVDDLYPPAST